MISLVAPPFLSDTCSLASFHSHLYLVYPFVSIQFPALSNSFRPGPLQRITHPGPSSESHVILNSATHGNHVDIRFHSYQIVSPLIPSYSSHRTGCSRPHECQTRNGRKSCGRGSSSLTTMSRLPSSRLSEGTVCGPRLGISYLPGTNVTSPANFRPYSYGELVSLCYPIAQHICTIFIFLATFVRIKERMLDPRLLVWASIFAFALGYVVWQAVEVQLASKFRQVRKPTNRRFRDPPTFPALY